VGEQDWTLLLVLNAVQQVAKTDAAFTWSVWFLELDGTPLSYTLLIEYGDVAYFVKTSYDEAYNRYYPGILIQNHIIRELFLEGKHRYIDFLSDLPYMHDWTDQWQPRINYQLTKGLMPRIIRHVRKETDYMFEKPLIKKILSVRMRTKIGWIEKASLS